MVSFVTQRCLVPAAIAALIQHGCVVCIPDDTCCEVVFPEGTVKEEIWPRVGGDIYELRLPDGYVCVAQYVRYYEQYVIFYQPEKEQPPNH